jgi:hypothetical protein
MGPISSLRLLLDAAHGEALMAALCIKKGRPKSLVPRPHPRIPSAKYLPSLQDVQFSLLLFIRLRHRFETNRRCPTKLVAH